MEEQLRKSEHWFASTLRCVSDAVIATDADSRVTFLNPAAELLTGWDAKEAEGHPIDELVRLVSRRDGTAIESVAQRAMRENKAVGIEFGTRLIMQSGETVPVDDSAAPIRDENDKLLGVIIVMRDVSERLRQEELLRNSEERFRNAFEFSAAGMAMVGLEGDFLQINDAFCIMVGYPHEELMGKPHTLVGYIAAPEQERDCLYSLLSGEAPSVQFEKCYRHRDGREVWTLASVSLLTAGEQPVCYLYQVYDVTERKEAEVQLERMAYSDPLTGLNNRAHLGREIERMLAEARRHRQHLAVVFVDLDRFKQINDTLGHLAGDELLRVAAERLRWEGFNVVSVQSAGEVYERTQIWDFTTTSKGSPLPHLVYLYRRYSSDVVYQPTEERAADFRVILGADYDSCISAHSQWRSEEPPPTPTPLPTVVPSPAP